MIEQIITDNGFAAWKVLYWYKNLLISPRGLNTLMYSLASFSPYPYCNPPDEDKQFIWKPEKQFEATNFFESSEAGIYCYKTEYLSDCLAAQTQLRSGRSIVEHLTIMQGGNHDLYTLIICRLRIWGHVRKHTIGYKAQFAYPELIFSSESRLYQLQNEWKHSEVMHYNTLLEFATDFIECKNCHTVFTLSELHKRWFSERNYEFPKICINCAKFRKEESKSLRFIEKYVLAKQLNAETTELTMTREKI